MVLLRLKDDRADRLDCGGVCGGDTGGVHRIGVSQVTKEKPRAPAQIEEFVIPAIWTRRGGTSTAIDQGSQFWIGVDAAALVRRLLQIVSSPECSNS